VLNKRSESSQTWNRREAVPALGFRIVFDKTDDVIVISHRHEHGISLAQKEEHAVL